MVAVGYARGPGETLTICFRIRSHSRGRFETAWWQGHDFPKRGGSGAHCCSGIKCEQVRVSILISFISITTNIKTKVYVRLSYTIFRAGFLEATEGRVMLKSLGAGGGGALT